MPARGFGLSAMVLGSETPSADQRAHLEARIAELGLAQELASLPDGSSTFLSVDTWATMSQKLRVALRILSLAESPSDVLFIDWGLVGSVEKDFATRLLAMLDDRIVFLVSRDGRIECEWARGFVVSENERVVGVGDARWWGAILQYRRQRVPSRQGRGRSGRRTRRRGGGHVVPVKAAVRRAFTGVRHRSRVMPRSLPTLPAKAPGTLRGRELRLRSGSERSKMKGTHALPLQRDLPHHPDDLGSVAGGRFLGPRLLDPLLHGLARAPRASPGSSRTPTPWAGILPLTFFALRSRGLYLPQRTGSLIREVGGVISAVAITVVIVLAADAALRTYLSRAVIALFAVLAAGSISTIRIAGRGFLGHLRRKGYNLRYLVVVGAGDLAAETIDSIHGHPEAGLRVLGVLSNDPTAAGRTIQGVRVVGDYASVKQQLRSATGWTRW